jgi:hypothetical protein
MRAPVTGEINFNVVFSFTQKNPRTSRVSFENFLSMYKIL